ncbi:MAG: hypothetical protein ACOY4Q_09920 [Bacillota bacterium]
MPVKISKPLHPNLIPILAAPAFLFGAVLAGLNWGALGFPQKQKNTIKYSIIGTLVLLVVIFTTPMDLVRKAWSVGLGINLGVGMALRTLQLPAYEKWLATRGKVKK